MKSEVLRRRDEGIAETMHLATGGTIDSYWDAAQDTAVPNSRSVIPEYLAEALRINLPSRTLFLNDIRHINMTDKGA